MGRQPARVLLLGLLLSGCGGRGAEQERPAPAAEAMEPRLDTLAEGRWRVAASEDGTGRAWIRGDQRRYLELARRIPGFAGYYWQGGTWLVVLLRDTARADAARRELQPMVEARYRELSRHGTPTRPRILVRQARFSYDQLFEWNDRATPVLRLPAVSSLGIDIRANTLLVGVEDSTGIAAAREQLEQLGIPAAAFRFEISRVQLDDSPARPRGAALRPRRAGT